MSSLAELEFARSNVLVLIESTTTLLANARASEISYTSLLQLAQNEQERTQYQAGITQARADIKKYTAELTQLEIQLADINAQIARLKEQSTPKDSAGTIVTNAQRARDDGANDTAPPTGELVVGADGRIVSKPATATPSNAEKNQTELTTGTNGEVRKISDTQSTPPPTSNTPVQPGSPSTQVSGANNSAGPYPGGTRGTGAGNEDAGTGANATQTRISSIFAGAGARIVPQDNILSKYSSYTYNISIYLMSKDNFTSLLKNQSSLNGFNLLMQSGGAPIAGRNQFFPLDYYIDDVKIRSVISGRGSGGAHNSVSMTFSIIEPNGITFIPNLVAATQKYVTDQGGPAPQNYAAQNFLMVIRFYGYDSAGNLVNATGSVQNADGSVGPQPIAQKLIPFQFTAVKFKIANKLTEYYCEAVCPQNLIAAGGARGVIPYNVELTSTTLKELLTGNAKFAATTPVGGEGRTSPIVTAPTASRTGKTATLSPEVTGGVTTAAQSANLPAGAAEALGLTVDQNQTAAETNRLMSTAPPKASAAPAKTLIGGLTDALNGFQKDLVSQKIFEYPDVYQIEIPEAIIQNAKVQPPDASAGLASVPMTSATTAAQAKLGIKQSVDRNSKNVSATAGMGIVQFLDQIVRTSTYIVDQQTKIITQDANGKEITVPNGVPGNTLAWYRIGMQVEPYKYDSKRRDWAYKITYSINPYKVNDVKSDYFPNSKFTGVHKQYKYWFTGENTEILDYQQDYNYLYYIVTNAEQQVPSYTTDYRSYEKRAFQPRSNESAQGAPGKVFEPSASAASILYSPADTARVKLKIVGDPAWIQQGELWTGVEGLDKFYYGPFLPDGTINYDSQEILFEVLFNTPVDYNLQTGLMKRGF